MPEQQRTSATEEPSKKRRPNWPAVEDQSQEVDSKINVTQVETVEPVLCRQTHPQCIVISEGRTICQRRDEPSSPTGRAWYICVGIEG